MKDLDFLRMLKAEGKLDVAEPSSEISLAYSMKSSNCLKSAKILLQAKLYENSVSEAYYAMYNSALALLFKCGIKSESHSGTIILLERLFGLVKERVTLANAKKERIDKQYYVTDQASEIANEGSAKQIIKDAEQFTLQIAAYSSKIMSGEIGRIRDQLKSISR